MAVVMVSFSLMCPLCGRLVDELCNQRRVRRAGGGQALRGLVFLEALHTGLAEDAVGLDVGATVREAELHQAHIEAARQWALVSFIWIL